MCRVVSARCLEVTRLSRGRHRGHRAAPHPNMLQGVGLEAHSSWGPGPRAPGLPPASRRHGSRRPLHRRVEEGGQAGE